MNSLEHLVEQVVYFFGITLPNSQVKGPFTRSELKLMFNRAHFCGDLINTHLPASYTPTIEKLQNQYPLSIAPKMLLLALGENLRVNFKAMEVACRLHDRQEEDLDTSLYHCQRNYMRDQFLSVSQALRNTDKWQQLRSFLNLIEIDKKDQGLNILVTEKTDKALLVLLLNDDYYLGIQQRVEDQLLSHLTFDMLEKLEKKLLANVVSIRKKMLSFVLRTLEEYLNSAEDNVIERASCFLSEFLELLNSSVLKEVLGRLELGINNRFIREELLNCIISKCEL